MTVCSVTLTDADVPVELRNGRVSAPYFEIFGAKRTSPGFAAAAILTLAGA
jgi:hypothetical protein